VHCLLKVLLRGDLYYYINLGILSLPLSRKMIQGACGSHDVCAWTLRPFDGWTMYTDIDCEYTPTFLLHLI